MRIALFLLSILLVRSSLAEPILIIGDSLTCGSFGAQLFQNMSQDSSGKPNDVTLYCMVSSAPLHWIHGENSFGGKDPKTGKLIALPCQTMSSAKPILSLCRGTGKAPTLSQILAQHKGEHTIIALGTNSLLSPGLDGNYSQMAKAVAANSAGKSCQWIGPPHLNPAESKGFPPGRLQMEEGNLGILYASLKSKVNSSCALVDSRAATDIKTATPGHDGSQTVDGVHRNKVSGVYWANAINGDITQLSLASVSGKTSSPPLGAPNPGGYQ